MIFCILKMNILIILGVYQKLMFQFCSRCTIVKCWPLSPFQLDTVIMLKPYFTQLTPSEFHCYLVGAHSTIAGFAFGLFVLFGVCLYKSTCFKMACRPIYPPLNHMTWHNKEFGNLFNTRLCQSRTCFQSTGMFESIYIMPFSNHSDTFNYEDIYESISINYFLQVPHSDWRFAELKLCYHSLKQSSMCHVLRCQPEWPIYNRYI